MNFFSTTRNADEQYEQIRQRESFVHQRYIQLSRNRSGTEILSSLAVYPWEREFDSAKLPELRFLGLGISLELLRVSSCRRSFVFSTLSLGVFSHHPVLRNTCALRISKETKTDDDDEF